MRGGQHIAVGLRHCQNQLAARAGLSGVRSRHAGARAVDPRTDSAAGKQRLLDRHLRRARGHIGSTKTEESARIEAAIADRAAQRCGGHMLGRGLIYPCRSRIGISVGCRDFRRMRQRGRQRVLERGSMCRAAEHQRRGEPQRELESAAQDSHLNAVPGRTPMALNAIAAGQNPVNPAWIMLSPAKADRPIHQGWTASDRAIPSSTTKPAKIITARSRVMVRSFQDRSSPRHDAGQLRSFSMPITCIASFS